MCVCVFDLIILTVKNTSSYVEANGNNRSHNFIIKRKSNCSLEESRPTDNEPGMRSYGITLIIQHDPSFVDSHDLSRQLQCNWFRHLRRTITHSPIPVLSLAESRLAYPGEQVNVWMDVQRGKLKHCNFYC